MTRLELERRQVAVYAAAIAVGLALGGAWPALGPAFEALLWPALVALLFVTFAQMPLLHLREAFADRRFVGAVLVGNFIAVPLALWAATPWLPADPVLRLGIWLVLLVPCTDWFITFSQLGGGHVPRAVAVTPLNLLLQLALLPAYLWWLGGGETGAGHAAVQAVLTPAVAVPALLIVALPLAAAALAERWVEADPARERWRARAAWAPVPLLALVVLLIAGAQVQATRAALPELVAVVPVFVAYLVLAALLALALARLWRLPADQARTLAFSLGTRNSFVVLPLALALPPPWTMAAVVVVLQSLVELIGMLVYMAWLPRWGRPAPRG